MSRASLAGAQSQARLQVASEDAGHIEYELLEPERDAAGALVANRGLLALPEPVAGDLFFDIEGARYYSEDGKEFGLQYLFGIIDTADVDASGTPRYTQIWAFDRAGREAGLRGTGRLHHRPPASGRPACTSTTTTTTSRRRSITSPNCTRPGRRPSGG